MQNVLNFQGIFGLRESEGKKLIVEWIIVKKVKSKVSSNYWKLYLMGKFYIIKFLDDINLLIKGSKIRHQKKLLLCNVKRSDSMDWSICVSTDVYIYIYIYIHTYVSTNKGNSGSKIWHWTNKWWNRSSCTKLALSASWTHYLMSQLVRASERNSVVVGSNPTKANFLQLLQRNLQWWARYVSAHSATLMWLPQENFN